MKITVRSFSYSIDLHGDTDRDSNKPDQAGLPSPEGIYQTVEAIQIEGHLS